jgi:hypothetical protein
MCAELALGERLVRAGLDEDALEILALTATRSRFTPLQYAVTNSCSMSPNSLGR